MCCQLQMSFFIGKDSFAIFYMTAGENMDVWGKKNWKIIGSGYVIKMGLRG